MNWNTYWEPRSVPDFTQALEIPVQIVWKAFTKEWRLLQAIEAHS